MSLTKDTHLTPNFTLGEFLTKEDAIPPPEVVENLRCLANRLQAVRDFFGKPIRITSGYRSAAHNQQVGGASGSYHTRGMAADIDVAGMTPQEVQSALSRWSGGLGRYPTHTHVDIRSYNARWGGNSH